MFIDFILFTTTILIITFLFLFNLKKKELDMTENNKLANSQQPVVTQRYSVELNPNLVTETTIVSHQPLASQTVGLTTGTPVIQQPLVGQNLGLTTGTPVTQQPLVGQNLGLTTGIPVIQQPLVGQNLGLTTGQPIVVQQPLVDDNSELARVLRSLELAKKSDDPVTTYLDNMKLTEKK